MNDALNYFGHVAILLLIFLLGMWCYRSNEKQHIESLTYRLGLVRDVAIASVECKYPRIANPVDETGAIAALQRLVRTLELWRDWHGELAIKLANTQTDLTATTRKLELAEASLRYHGIMR